MSSTTLPLPFDTRKAARDRVQPNIEQTYRRILDEARRRGSYGLTANELIVAWGCDPNHIAPRCTELVNERKQLIDSGRRRRTRSGASARVLVLPEFAQ